MIVRIVRMTFEPAHAERFRELFAGWRSRISAFPGCLHLELLRDLDDPRVFLTISHWDAAADLEAYRTSDLFASVWPVVKPLFAARTEAWTMEPIAGTGQPLA